MASEFRARKLTTPMKENFLSQESFDGRREQRTANEEEEAFVMESQRAVVRPATV